MLCKQVLYFQGKMKSTLICKLMIPTFKPQRSPIYSGQYITGLTPDLCFVGTKVRKYCIEYNCR